MTYPADEQQAIIIRPGVSVLSLFRHLNYKPWYAMAEFVDNSLQSFLSSRSDLQKVGSQNLLVEIEFDAVPPGKIVIRDNAAGISAGDYSRAFRPAQPPPDRTGLAEFGIGMKSAACWFADSWTVRSKALGEPVERTIAFDVSRIVEKNVEELFPTERTVSKTDHYTEITLRALNQPLRAQTVTRIKDHLASIYRKFELSGSLRIRFGRDFLHYDSPNVLVAPSIRSPAGPPVTWRKNLDFELAPSIHVRGWAAIRQTASVSQAGFALFRRGRLIEGSADDTYRPASLFGRQNSYTFQRLFGEFEIDGIRVSHTKDGFQWEGHEEEFLERLRLDLNRPTLPILDQAEGYRVRAQTSEIAEKAQAVLDSTVQVLTEHSAPILDSHSAEAPLERLPQGLPTVSRANLAGAKEFRLAFHQTDWLIRVDLTNEAGVGEWLTVSSPLRLEPANRTARRELAMRMSLAHPFMQRYAGASEEDLEPLVRLGVAMGLAEVVAREAGIRNPSAIRDTINDLLRNVLSRATEGPRA